MKDEHDEKIYLTDLFLDSGDLVPFVIVEKWQQDNRLRLKIKAFAFNAREDRLIYSGEDRDFWGEKVLADLTEEEVLDITKFYAKKELTSLISDKLEIKFRNNFNLEDCSLGKLYLLTGAELRNNKNYKYFDSLSCFGGLYAKLNALLQDSSDSLTVEPNEWRIRGVN